MKKLLLFSFLLTALIFSLNFTLLKESSDRDLRATDVKGSVNIQEPGLMAPNTVLWDQMDSAGGTGSASQQFPDFSNAIIESADDFVVPAGVQWRIDSIDCGGQWSAAGPMVTMRYFIYNDSANVGLRPGAVVWADSLIVPITALNNANPTFRLPTSRTLGPGRYWIAVMTVHPFNTSGQWFWSTRRTRNSVCVLRDRANLLAGGTAWRVTTTSPNQGLRFRLRGEVLAGGNTVYSRCKTGLNIAIPDNNPAGATDTFVVAGIPGGKVIKNVWVKFDTLVHSWVGDLRLRLTKGATTVQLCRNPGSGINGSSGDNFIGTGFADSSRFSIDSILTTTGQGQLSAPYTGWFRTNVNAPNTLPVMDSLARFKNLDPNGTWTLFMSDSAGADTGALRSWCLYIEWGDPVGVSQTSTEVPNNFFLSQNYPNPFNPTTNIKFGLPKAGVVKLVVFDILGREVATLLNEFKPAGQFVADFDASMLSSGVYFYRIESGDFVETKKMLLVK